MKKSILILAALLAAGSAYARGGGGYGSFGGHSGSYHSSMPSYGTGSNPSHEHVSGYTRRDGTYVAPHERSTPDSTKNNNWSTKGNVNPYTGVPGTKRGDD